MQRAAQNFLESKKHGLNIKIFTCLIFKIHFFFFFGVCVSKAVLGASAGLPDLGQHPDYQQPFLWILGDKMVFIWNSSRCQLQPSSATLTELSFLWTLSFPQ